MWTPELRAAIRDFLAPRVHALRFDEDGGISPYLLTEPDRDAHCHPGYGYRDDARDGSCEWVLPERALLAERTVYRIDNPRDGGKDTPIVVITNARCACKKYRNETLWYDGSLADLFAEMFSLHGGSILL